MQNGRFLQMVLQSQRAVAAGLLFVQRDGRHTSDGSGEKQRMQTSSKQPGEPLVSIIIPTYKRSETLVRAVDSCLRQTYAHIEVLVVDDNPQKSDARRATEDAMRRYAGDMRVRYLRRDQNGGGALARNTGIESAQGLYVTFLDDDDEYFENKIAEQVREMDQGVDMIFSDIEIVDLNSNTRQIHTYRRDFSLDYRGLLTKHLVDVISGTPTFMYTREALRRIGGFDDIPANQEYVLMLKTIAHRLKIGYLPKVLCRAYMGGPGLRISDGDQIIKAKIDVIRRIRPFLKDIARVDRRRTMCRLNAFVFYQSLKRQKATALVYGFKLLGYVDLLLWSRRRHSHKGDVLYK
jgi:glycosyltransferase involved in cell wall biosynthesis